MSRTLITATATGLLVLSTAAAAQAPAKRDKAPWSALTNGVEAAEIVLRDVCLPGIAEGKSIAQLAEYEWLVAMPSSAVRAGPADKVWRIGSLRAVYAVAWADGSCSTYAEGAAADLRQMAERTILARPEGFARGRSGPVDGGRLERTVYCARGRAMTAWSPRSPHRWASRSAVRGRSPRPSTAPRAGASSASLGQWPELGAIPIQVGVRQE